MATAGCTALEPDPAEFYVESIRDVKSDTDSEEITIAVDVRNNGEVEGEKMVALRIGGDVVGTHHTVLGEGETVTVSFNVPYTDVETGEQQVTVTTVDDVIQESYEFR